MVKPMVHSEKHIINITPSTLAATSISNLTVAFATADPGSSTTEVREGSTIKAVYVEMWFLSNDSSRGSLVAFFEKLPSLATAITYGQSVALNTWTNKKNIFYTTQGLTSATGGTPIPFLRFWIKIPKSKQRMGLGDKLLLNISSIVGTLAYCGQFTFKEYY